MRVLVVGSGGREHALCWALSGSPLLDKLWCAPGNAGTAEVAENIAIGVTDVAELVRFARENQVDLIVPGPEAPLVAGLADACAAAGLRCIGPSAAAAQLEGSKSFTKDIADAAGIPTAAWEKFEDADAALDFVRRRGAPIVIKADGLAAGKGVVVAMTLDEAEDAITDQMRRRILGDAGSTVVIEECLFGEEMSLFALCDGTTALPIGLARDHKRVGDGDTGPNTGGMGAVSVKLPPGSTLLEDLTDTMIRPALAEMARRGTPFRGILFAGLMITEAGAYLIEYNVRFGDPECQALLPRLKSDLLPALIAACDGELSDFDLRWSDEASIVIVMAAKGYPGSYAKGGHIRNLDAANALPGVRIFHAGTESRDGEITSIGGRVLGICATAPNLAEAQRRAYAAVDTIDFPDGFCRRDIGATFKQS